MLCDCHWNICAPSWQLLQLSWHIDLCLHNDSDSFAEVPPCDHDGSLSLLLDSVFHAMPFLLPWELLRQMAHNKECKSAQISHHQTEEPVVLAILAPRRLLHQKLARRRPACSQDTSAVEELPTVLSGVPAGWNSDLPALPPVQDTAPQELAPFFHEELHFTGDQLHA